MTNWKLIGIGIVAAIILGAVVLGLFVVGTQRDLVNKDNTVEQKWGNVQTAYQRRADLIPNLVATVQGAATFEKGTQTEIAAMRSQAGQIKTQMYNAQNAEELQAADQSMGNVLSRLMLVVEAYPELKSNENFLNLQGQLEGTENRIKYERDEYNAAVKDYKNTVQMIPTTWVAGMFGFNSDKWKTFKATDEAQTAPTVTFNFGPVATV
jgi:LemA protein